MTAKFLQPESRKPSSVDSTHSRFDRRSPRKAAHADAHDPADTSTLRQAPTGQEFIQGQPNRKSALVLPDFRDAYFKQKSAGEKANEQLNPDGKRDQWAAGIQRAAVPDCVDEQVGGGLLGIPILIYKATSGKCK
ncbi:hypothetical protein DBR37_02445 [Herminiimonas sp. KBW02]|uniref:hypothetical protein n=1 Tax=Herminiimonas sp. KBW02 TaxID=2153363 RepID=UPI000F59910A|nr:hypothetical protein [Herminiimonas sp. KBW02]RQO37074.1 hypothetical protein DBR37_02445 [Herminiimonas sp. KBW02]